MATYVEVGGLKIFIDPGVALGPRRYGLPPHEVEKFVMDRQWRDIVEYASKADVVIVTHYHYDHHNPRQDVDKVYAGKDIYIKDPYTNINPSQIRRSRFFLHRLRESGVDMDRVYIADGNSVEYGGVKIVFSPPFYHGESPKLGYVVMVYIEYGGYSLLYTSDVEGPLYEDPYRYILHMQPNLLILDGPPTYLESYEDEVLWRGLDYISRLMTMEWLETLVIEHHFLRDRDYKRILAGLDGYAEYGWKIRDFATYMGKPQMFYEMFRKELYYGEGAEDT